MENIVLQKRWVQGGNVVVDDLRGTMITGEAGAHTFQISGVDSAQETVAITGTITGRFLTATNVTVPLTGSVSDGVASLTLTEDCYVIPGRFVLSVYATNGSTTQCIYCAVGNVFRTQSDIIEYPSASIPDIEQIIADAQAAVTQINADVTAAQAAVAAAQTAVDGIEAQRQTMIASIASVAGQGTDTTLSQSGVAADAKAAGDQISDLKSAFENIDADIANGYKNADLDFAHGWFSSGSYNPSDNRYISKVFKTDDLINLVNGSSKAGYLQYFSAWTSWENYTYGTYQAVSAGQTKAINKQYAYVAYQSSATVESELSGIELQEALKVDYLSKAKFGWLDNSKNVLGLQWLAGYIGINGDMSAGATDRSCTTFIPCPPGTTINYKAETNHASVCGIAFYDKNRTFISGLANNATIGTEATATSPENTAYLRISTRNEIMADTYFKFDGYNQELLWLQRQISDLTVYVDGTNGNDTTGIGTSGAPYKTISKALTTAARHICINPGTYQEKVSASFREYLHLYADELSWGDYADRQKVIIDGDSSVDTPLDLSYIRELQLENIVVQYSASGKKGCVITNCEKLDMQNCEFHHNGHDGCVINYTNGVIRDCKASYNGNDGFNMNYYGDTQFYNCSGHDNVDDGISHHQGTTGMINGGEWYNNGKGGVASPAHGSQVDIYNVYCHNNGYGIYANADSDTTARTFHVWNSVLVNNSHYGITSKRNTAILYNCKITGNTEGQTTAPSGGSIVDLSN